MSRGKPEAPSLLVTHHTSLVTSSRFTLHALLAIFILNLVLQPLTEPDFGWHLRAGLDLWQHGGQMPTTDPYSHTMSDWPWVEHAWLTDGILALIYRGLGDVGALGAMLFFAAVTVGACMLATMPARAGWTARLIAISTVLWVARPFLGARTQFVTLLGLSVLLWIRHRVQAGSRTAVWAIPPLFLLWANLHGGFTAGLFVLGLLLGMSVLVRSATIQWPATAQRLDEPVPDWPQIGRLALAMGLAAAATLCNPYGWGLYREIIESLSDTFMLETLREWQPLSLVTTAGQLYLAYLAGLAVFMGIGYRRIEPVRWMLWLVFLWFSIRHWRNIPIFLIVSLPLCGELLETAVARAADRVPALRRYVGQGLLAASVCVAIALGLSGTDHLARVLRAGLSPEQFFRETAYPIEAVQWIKANRNKLGTRLFNEYGHGGFLLWWLSDERIFIDGRMPAWRIGDRKIFEDYLALTNRDPPALGVLDKYDVDWALVTRESALARALGGIHGWRMIYDDAKVRIFIRQE
jgi:hypothetical protein